MQFAVDIFVMYLSVRQYTVSIEVEAYYTIIQNNAAILAIVLYPELMLLS